MKRTRIQSIATERVLREINQVDSQPLIEAFIASTEVGPLKNVCAKLSPDLVHSMEERCALLGINKRQFIESAVIDAIAQVDQVVADEGFHEVLAERGQHDQEAAA
jgi:hypothetical protein